MDELNDIQKAFEELIVTPVVDDSDEFFSSFGDLWDKKDEAEEFLIQDLIAKHVVNMVVGNDGIGKTQLCVQLALHISLDIPTFLNLPLNATCKNTLIIATEDSKERFIKAGAKQAIALKPGVNPKDVTLDFLEASNFLDFESFIKKLIARLEKKPYEIIVTDALSDLFSLYDGSINDNGDARQILSILKKICQKYKTTLIVIHHVPKTKMYAKRAAGIFFLEKDDTQGASSITQLPRNTLGLTHDRKSALMDHGCYTNYLHILKTNVAGRHYYQNAIKMNFDLSTLIHSFQEEVNIEEYETAQGGGGGEMPKSKKYNEPATDKPKEAPLYTYEQHKGLMSMVFSKMDILDHDKIVLRMKDVYNCTANDIESNSGLLKKITAQGVIKRLKDNTYVLNFVMSEEDKLFIKNIPVDDGEALPF